MTEIEISFTDDEWAKLQEIIGHLREAADLPPDDSEEVCGCICRKVLSEGLSIRYEKMLQFRLEESRAERAFNLGSDENGD